MNTKTRKFEPYRELPTAEASYAEGYQIGLKWDAPWVPGGPWFVNVSDFERQSKNPVWVYFCDATVENNKEWRRGWEDGVRAQATTVTHPDHYYQKWNPRPKGSCQCGYHLLRQLVQTGG